MDRHFPRFSHLLLIVCLMTCAIAHGAQVARPRVSLPVSQPVSGSAASAVFKTSQQNLSSERIPLGFHVGVSTETTGYFSPSIGEPADSVYSQLGLSLKARSESDRFLGAIDAFGFLVIPDRSSVFVQGEIIEAYVGTAHAVDDRWSAKLGRKRENWSELDDVWNLGIWEPRFRWDYLHPTKVGLTGIFGEFRDSGLELNGLITPIFIPERGVPFQFFDGKIYSQHPFFNPPAPYYPILDQPTPAHYYLETPPIQQLIFKPGAAASVKYRMPEGVWFGGAVAYKPMNQLLLAYDGGFLTTPQLELPIAIYPRVVYHRLLSMEIGYKEPAQKPQWSVWTSATVESPEFDQTSPSWTTQEVSDALAWSAGAGVQGSAGDLTTSVLHVWGGNAADIGELKPDQGTAFESRYPYTTAVQLRARSAWLPLKQVKFGFEGKLLVDVIDSGAILSLDGRIGLLTGFSGYVGFDFLSSASPYTVDDPQAGFIARYRNHDRIRAGIGYAF